MFVVQKYPYLGLFVGLVLLVLPLAVLLHDAAAWILGGSGLWMVLRDAWDLVVWFVCGVFVFLNVVVSAGLTKLAYRKMLRRKMRYALFLAGAGACAAALVGSVLALVLGRGALGGSLAPGVLCYAAAVWVVAMLTLPVRLTRAPVQPVVFYRKK